LLKAVYTNKDVDKELTKIIWNKVSKDQLKGIDSPTLLAINVSDHRWSKNFFWNKGFVTNEMFLSIRNTNLREVMSLPYDISGLLIKYGDRLIARPNIIPKQILSDGEWLKLTKIRFLRRLSYPFMYKM
jgi:hypothetical protein